MEEQQAITERGTDEAAQPPLSSSASSGAAAAAAAAAEPTSNRNSSSASASACVLLRPHSDVTEWYLVGHREVGRGQFGVIRPCVERSTGLVLACKSIHKDGVVQSERDARAIRSEVRTMARVGGHPAVVHLRGAFEDAKSVHLVMDLCDGGDLFDLIKATGPLHERTAAHIFRHLLLALHHCHTLGVVHRDVKPENILLASQPAAAAAAVARDVAAVEPMKPASASGADADALQCAGAVKLTDFGVATFLPSAGEVLRVQELVGTPEYMAPEAWQGEYSPASDMWAAGVVLHVLLAGVPPFWAAEKDALVAAVRGKDVALKGRRWRGVSGAAKDVVKRLLRKQAGERPTASDLLGWGAAHCKRPARSPLAAILAPYCSLENKTTM
ncbi:unnamed protein product [Closterium sp. Yama58-4]|nr:unnamed protein product [Closterium sp. Yama58-4]